MGQLWPVSTQVQARVRQGWGACTAPPETQVGLRQAAQRCGCISQPDGGGSLPAGQGTGEPRWRWALRPGEVGADAAAVWRPRAEAESQGLERQVEALGCCARGGLWAGGGL